MSLQYDLEKIFNEFTCPACGYHVAVSFFDGGNKPLATIAWPSSPAEAKMMDRLPLEFVRCTDCGHVYNAQFDYDQVPYSDKPNLMFNKGRVWSGFISRTVDTIVSKLTDSPTVVEIGYGNGSFINSLAVKNPAGRYIGFDPNGSTDEGSNPKLYQEFFLPKRHLDEIRPELIITRHILEHLANPLGFLQELSTITSWIGHTLRVYLEVPCIDQAINTRRTVDFYYEHSSHFTTNSFSRMLECSGAEVEEIGYGYGNEIIYGYICFPMDKDNWKPFVDESICFRNSSKIALDVIGKQLNKIHISKERTAIWGGTGKSAAFMARYHLDSEQFPIVVDSDINKVGTFVPGTGQEIRYRDWLRDHPVDILIIPPQWRAADIIREMSDTGIVVQKILIEFEGRLVDFVNDPHPYKNSY